MPQNAPHLFRRDGEAMGDSGDLAILVFPHSANEKLFEFADHLLQSFISHRALRPRSKVRVLDAGVQDLGSEYFYFLP